MAATHMPPCAQSSGFIVHRSVGPAPALQEREAEPRAAGLLGSKRGQARCCCHGSEQLSCGGPWSWACGRRDGSVHWVLKCGRELHFLARMEAFEWGQCEQSCISDSRRQVRRRRMTTGVPPYVFNPLASSLSFQEDEFVSKISLLGNSSTFTPAEF